MKAILSKKLVYVCLLTSQLLTYSTAFAKSGGAIAGGGGDATEERVNEIRSDILKWIIRGGAKGLVLPSSLSYGEYESKMKEILQPQQVVVGFVEKDDEKNEELQVSVDGVPKTCRGFTSKKDFKDHILCNISRFKNTSDKEQYKLIHHEYAGLVNVENNQGAASDYQVSSQITEYLELQTVLKLALKNQSPPSSCKFVLTASQTKTEYMSKTQKFASLLTIDENIKILNTYMKLDNIARNRTDAEYESMTWEERNQSYIELKKLEDTNIIQLFFSIQVVAERPEECVVFEND